MAGTRGIAARDSRGPARGKRAGRLRFPAGASPWYAWTGRDIMTRSTADIQNSSTRVLLVRRVRVVLAVCILGGVVFGALDLASWRPELWISFAGKLVGMSLAVIAMVVIGQRWVVPRTWALAVFV